MSCVSLYKYSVILLFTLILTQSFHQPRALFSSALRSKQCLNFGVKVSLETAYEQCRAITAMHSKSFYIGTKLLDRDTQNHLCAIYTWCRRTDDLVDSPRSSDNIDQGLDHHVTYDDIETWKHRLFQLWRGEPVDLLDCALSATVKQFPSMPIAPFEDMIRGMLMDIPSDVGRIQNRYNSFADLYVYCYRVAGTVGLMTLPVLLARKNTPNMPTNIHLVEKGAISLGIAFQITNILRDVKEDLLRDRLYLPLDELQLFGISEKDIFEGTCASTKWKEYDKFIKFQVLRAKRYYLQAQAVIKYLHPATQFAIQASLDLYKQILLTIEKAPAVTLQRRVITSPLEKLTILPRSFLTSFFNRCVS